MAKVCTQCNVEQPATQYYGRSSWCKDCHSDYRRARALTHPDTYRDSYYRCVYGISLVQYEEMLAVQQGGCAICHQPCASGRRLSIDHDHACCPGTKSCGNCVRGLLCHHCNVHIVGIIENNAGLFAAALTYLGAADAATV